MENKVNKHHHVHANVKAGKVISIDIDCFTCKKKFNVKVGETFHIQRRAGENFYYCSEHCAKGN